MQPAYPQGQQLEGSQHTHQQRDFREQSEARTVNSTVPESKHISKRYPSSETVFAFIIIFLFNKEQSLKA
jgi:hypothetical protein